MMGYYEQFKAAIELNNRAIDYAIIKLSVKYPRKKFGYDGRIIEEVDEDAVYVALEGDDYLGYESASMKVTFEELDMTEEELKQSVIDSLRPIAEIEYREFKEFAARRDAAKLEEERRLYEKLREKFDEKR